MNRLKIASVLAVFALGACAHGGDPALTQMPQAITKAPPDVAAQGPDRGSPYSSTLQTDPARRLCDHADGNGKAILANGLTVECTWSGEPLDIGPNAGGS